MDEKKSALTYPGLSLFFQEIKKIFSSKSHKHSDADISSISSSKITGNIAASSVPWSGVSGKPSTFTPSSHTHDDRYFTETEINGKLDDKANVSDLDSHTENTTAHITSTERAKWNKGESNQNAFSNIVVGSTTIAADSKTDSLNLAAGSNIKITPDATNDKITIEATDTKYTHPTSSGNKHIPSGGSSGQFLKWSADGTAVWAKDNNTTYGNMKGATTSAAGAAGLVPAPSTGAANRYLRSDGTWQVPPDTKSSLSSLGITASAAELNKLDGCTATVAELNYVDGVTSNIQTQLNGKAAKTHNHILIQKTEPTSQNVGDAWLIEE